MFTTYRSRMMDVWAFAVRTSVRADTLFTLSDAITQLLPQTRFAMSLLWIVLFPDWEPSLFIPIQLIPARFASTLINALNTSLGVCTPPLVEGEAMSTLIGSLAAGSLNTKLLPGATTKLRRWWSGPFTMTERLLVAA
jgi:hypothetical protein